MCQVIVTDSVALGEESDKKETGRERATANEREKKRKRERESKKGTVFFFFFLKECVDIPKEIVKETQQTKSMKKTEPHQ